MRIAEFVEDRQRCCPLSGRVVGTAEIVGRLSTQVEQEGFARPVTGIAHVRLVEMSGAQKDKEVTDCVVAGEKQIRPDRPVAIGG